jgi:hypothetical protein
MPLMMDYSMELMGFSQYVTKLQNNESLIWIGFDNLKVGPATKIQNQHL